MTATVELRRASPEDDTQVLALLQASLGWVPDDAYARFFAWKHRSGPWGPSPAWVATEGERVVGFRSFLPWRFTVDGAAVRAVRAVDTATAPDRQGRGVFSRLTRHALEELRADGVGFVFNTPNEQSRPGYLKLGWQVVGRLPARVRLRSPASLPRLLGARTPAERWSAPSPALEAASVPVAEALADGPGVAALLAAQPADGIRTARSAPFLAWRYGFEPLGYRAVVAEPGVAGGLVVLRVRRRGPALEAAVCEVLLPPGDPGGARRLLARALRASGADHAVRLGREPVPAGFLPLPRTGPLLTWRGLGTDGPAADTGRAPELARWHLALGDVELL